MKQYLHFQIQAMLSSATKIKIQGKNNRLALIKCGPWKWPKQVTSSVLVSFKISRCPFYSFRSTWQELSAKDTDVKTDKFCFMVKKYGHCILYLVHVTFHHQYHLH